MTLDLSRYDPGELSLEQLAAFWRLGHVTASDIPRLAMYWLEHGADSNAIAVLAGESDPTIREHGQLFERALLDIGVAPENSREQDFWILIQFLLSRIAAEGRDPFPEAENLIMDVLWREQDLQLFLRPDLPPLHARNGIRYVGEGMAIENVIGATYELDEIDDHKAKAVDVARIKRQIKDAAASILMQFYTIKPSHFPGRPTASTNPS